MKRFAPTLFTRFVRISLTVVAAAILPWVLFLTGASVIGAGHGPAALMVASMPNLLIAPMTCTFIWAKQFRRHSALILSTFGLNAVSTAGIAAALGASDGKTALVLRDAPSAVHSFVILYIVDVVALALLWMILAVEEG